MYSRQEVNEESLKYFKGDELAANVFTTKYALKTKNGKASLASLFDDILDDYGFCGLLSLIQALFQCIAGGFSDKILQFIPMFEESHEDMLKKIESIQI